MKSLLLVFILLFTVSSIAYSQEDIGPAKPPLCGRVHNIRSYSTLISGNGLSQIGQRSLSSVETFDRNRQRMDSRHYGRDSLRANTQVRYSYDSNGREIETINIYKPDEPRKVVNKTIYRYNSGKLSISKQINPDNECYNFVAYKYDDSGRKIEETKFEDSGVVLYSRKFFAYSNNNKIVEVKEYWNFPFGGQKGIGDRKLKYEGTKKFSFDDAGRLVQVVRSGFADEFNEVFINKLDDCTDTIGARVVVKTVYQYDASGLLIKESELDRNGQPIYTDTYEYSDFDQTGNWCKQTSTRTSFTSTCKPTVRLSERKIEYY